MIKFEKVSIKNFKSFGNKPSSIPLDKTGTTLIVGNNEDIGEKGNSRNSCGKTAGLSAVVFALYGKDLDKLKPDELINLRNGKGLRVELDFTVKGEPFKIIRGRKPNILELYHGDTTITRDSMKNTEQEIMNIIGIPYDVFLSVFFLNPFKDTFMSMTSAMQRNFMESVLSLDTLANRAESLKAIKKELGVDIKLAKKDLDNAIAIREREEKQLENLKKKEAEFEANRSDAIEEHRLVKKESENIPWDALIEEAKGIKPNDTGDRIKALKKEIQQHEQQKNAIMSQIKMAEREVEKAQQWENIQKASIESLEEKIKTLPSIEEVRERGEVDEQILSLENQLLQIQDKQRVTKEKDIPALQNEQEALEREFSYLEGGECPYCKQSHTDDSRMAEIADEFEAIADRMQALEDTLADQMKRYDEKADELESLKKSRPDIDASITERDIASMVEKLEQLKEQTNPHEAIELDVSVDDVLVIDEKIQSIQSTIDELKEEHDSYEVTQKAIKDYLEGEIGAWDIEEIKQMKWEVDQIDRLIEEEKEKTNPFTDQVNDMSEFTDVDSYDEAVSELEEKEKHCVYLVKMLTDPKSFIRKNIVDQYVPYLNKKINEYTQFLDLPHVTEINSDMTVDIEYMGKNVSYFTLSRGERLRVDVATAMAFRDLMKVMGKGMNLLLVDEVLDSALDPHGTRKTFEFIKQFASNILLVSHREEFQTMVDDVMVMNKRNGFTVIS